MRSKVYRLEKILTFYHVVIRALENFLQAREVQIQIFYHLKKLENHAIFSIFCIVR